MENDNELIRRAQSGDSCALAQLLRTHQPFVQGVIRSILTNAFDQEDAFQEIWVKIQRKIIRFEFRSMFSTWLYSISRRTCIDYQRKNKRAFATLPENGPPDVADGRAYSEDDLIRKRYTETIFARLSLPSREILILIDFEELSSEEAAKELGISAAAARQRYRRARQQFMAAAMSLGIDINIFPCPRPAGSAPSNSASPWPGSDSAPSDSNTE